MSHSSPIHPEQGLPRALSPAQMSMVGFGAIISFGLVSGIVLPLYLSGSAAVLAYVAAALVFVLLIHCMAMLTTDSAEPRSFSEAIAHHLGGRAACFTRVVYFLVVTAIVGTEITLLAPVVAPWVPWLPGSLVGLSGLLLPAIVIGYGARMFARVEAFLAIVKICAVLGLIVMSGRVVGSVGDVSALGTAWLHGMVRADAGAFWTSFVLAVLGFVGIESLSFAARETAASTSVLRSRMVAAACWLALLVLVMMLVASALLQTGFVPPNLLPVQYLLALVSKPHAHILFSALIVVTVLSVINSQLYSATRVLYEAARAGELPRCLGRLDAGSPRVATLAAFVCSAAVFFAVVHGDQSLFQIATAVATVGALAVWLMVFMVASRCASSAIAAGRPLILRSVRARLGLIILLLIVVTLPFIDFFKPVVRPGVSALVLAGVAAFIFDARRRLI